MEKQTDETMQAKPHKPTNPNHGTLSRLKGFLILNEVQMYPQICKFFHPFLTELDQIISQISLKLLASEQEKTPHSLKVNHTLQVSDLLKEKMSEKIESFKLNVTEYQTKQFTLIKEVQKEHFNTHFKNFKNKMEYMTNAFNEFCKNTETWKAHAFEEEEIQRLSQTIQDTVTEFKLPVRFTTNETNKTSSIVLFILNFIFHNTTEYINNERMKKMTKDKHLLLKRKQIEERNLISDDVDLELNKRIEGIMKRLMKTSFPQGQNGEKKEKRSSVLPGKNTKGKKQKKNPKTIQRSNKKQKTLSKNSGK